MCTQYNAVISSHRLVVCHDVHSVVDAFVGVVAVAVPALLDELQQDVAVVGPVHNDLDGNG